MGHMHSVILADVYARYKNLKLSVGTDEHGLKVMQSAQKHGVTPRVWCDKIHLEFKQMFDAMEIDYARCVRTTEKRHVETAQSLFRKIKEYVYLGKHAGWYDSREEAFVSGVTDDEAKEKGLVWVEEPNYKFKLSEFRGELEQWLRSNERVVMPAKQKDYVLTLIREDQLRDISVSRLRKKVDWGIPVPNDPEHTIYVWLDALANYLTVCGDEWPAEVQIIGKDIVKFHAVYWPAFLMAAGMPLPKRIVSHSHWTVDGVKMSKSIGNVVTPQSLLDRFDVEQVRYLLMRESNLDSDSNFVLKEAVNRVNADLVSNYGNLVSRTCALLRDLNYPSPMKEEPEFRESIESTVSEYHALMDAFETRRVLSSVMDMFNRANEYLTIKEPWNLKKAGKFEELDHILYHALETIRIGTQLLAPFTPLKSAFVLNHLGFDTCSLEFGADRSSGIKRKGGVQVFRRAEFIE